MFRIPNIYTYKNLKLFILIPVALMLVGIYLWTQIVLDASLRGGVSIIIQTNTTLSPSALAGAIASSLHISGASIATSPGGLQITLPINQSLANGENYLIVFYAQRSNYTNYLLNATSLSIAYHNNTANSTLLAQLKQANARINSSIAAMSAALTSEASVLRPLLNIQPSWQLPTNYNTSSPGSMLLVAQAAYSNASSRYQNGLIAGLHNVVSFSSYSYQQVTPTLGQFFLQQFTNTIVIAFVLVFIVVFFIFRSPIPSLAVVFGAANDIIIALGAMGLFKIPLGVASIAGLLMLIGYSIDTDVLTAIRILRRGEGRPEDRAYSSMKTGVTMTATAIVSFLVLFVVSLIEYVPTYYQISGVVLMGLIGDVFTTWLGNASMILLYKKRKEGL